jgi:enamine deaminase RidA (YjgF/YER057c/UK114 family)
VTTPAPCFGQTLLDAFATGNGHRGCYRDGETDLASILIHSNCNDKIYQFNPLRGILSRMTMDIRVLCCVLLSASLLESASSRHTKKEFLNVGGHQPPGYTHVVTSAPGTMIFISGRGGAAADGSLPADFKTQAQNTFEDLRRCLNLAGATFQDVVKINYFVTDLANTAALRNIRANYLDMSHPPAATLVQAGLSGGALVEIEAIAVISAPGGH